LAFCFDNYLSNFSEFLVSSLTIPVSGTTMRVLPDIHPDTPNAQVAELVDALASGVSDRKVVEVRVFF